MPLYSFLSKQQTKSMKWDPSRLSTAFCMWKRLKSVNTVADISTDNKAYVSNHIDAPCGLTDWAALWDPLLPVRLRMKKWFFFHIREPDICVPQFFFFFFFQSESNITPQPELSEGSHLHYRRRRQSRKPHLMCKTTKRLRMRLLNFL